MQISPPWRPVEYLFRHDKDLNCTVDNWSYATTVAEITQWCLNSKTRLGYQEDGNHFNREDKGKLLQTDKN